ncbi:hypothetical protein CcCBS67573_g00784 [Chytriomyces confervae]|uniref:Uncharacterized protein n=1 Tax=Chytriomyces confervae TaxID=246404 RepID=A0A507FNU9_9FUNG|nr:hypothetical protein CcCBS67573_g00784 [Chytriomyces confervae]
MFKMGIVSLILLAAQTSLLVSAHGQEVAHQHIPFNLGDLVTIECPKIYNNGSISSTIFEPLHCADTNTPLALPFGMDAILQCVWSLDEPMYNMISLSLDMQASYSCRMPMTKEGGLYFPLTFAFWGKKEEEHIHIMTHWNFLFHAVEGFFLGGTVYPLRDHWVMAVKGSIILIHGPVRWFAGHTFEGTMEQAALLLANAQEADNTGAGDTIPAANEANKAKPPPANRPIIANSKQKKGGNVIPVKAKDLPTVSKLLSSVPKTMVFFYVLLSVGATMGLAGLVYYAYLKPKLLLEKKTK